MGAWRQGAGRDAWRVQGLGFRVRVLGERLSRGRGKMENNIIIRHKTKIMMGLSPGHMEVHAAYVLWQSLPLERGGGGGGIPIRLKITPAHCAVEALVMLMLRRKARYELGARIRGRSRRGLGEREAEAAVAAVRHAPRVYLGNRDQDPERLGPDRCCRCTCMHVQKKTQKKGTMSVGHACMYRG